MADARAKLAEFSKLQDTKANVDAATVFLVPIPASKLSGDHAGDVAKYKGEVEAIETAQVKTKLQKTFSELEFNQVTGKSPASVLGFFTSAGADALLSRDAGISPTKHATPR
jgi:hypothetical protein